ncbi:unnamed protein product [Rotaria sordida]|uniref:Uncharacterized protein n=1 Tax=Rotaria sordida TaxID=392033 RepID=A0A813P4W1_9BILA|nr:unnamed protein product [Rotaria sordida]CAF0789274.1 unnamed protein product [Rotaria sordida]CAF0932908.1 unnamed protein product [Rotaria sordida]CAF0938127.1 unnamed protein product [Rotaria sordida]CAF1017997.1 unnamed protein product [Rotaria sordida]
MHESTNRNINSSSSLLLSNSNRSLNIHPPKLTRSLQQDNASKKLKITHGNGIKPIVDGNSTVRSSKTDTSLRCPLRQTLPIFKQPVTHYPIQRDEVKAQINHQTKSNNNGKPSEKTKPRQLFWEKRFQNIRPIDIDEKPFEQIKLPEPIKSVGLNMSPETVLISLATSLHLYSNSRALFGQNKQFQKNPTIFIQRDQPLINYVNITDEHIRAQEEKVNELRKRIQQTMSSNDDNEI